MRGRSWIAGVCAVAAVVLTPVAADGRGATKPRTRVLLTQFSLRHTVVAKWSQPYVFSITRGGDGAMWFGTRGVCGDNACSAIGRITPSGKTRFFPVPDGASVSYLATGPDGNVWFTAGAANQYQGEVGLITPDGRYTVMSSAPTSLVGELAPGPGGMWFSDSGRISVLASTGSITTFTLPSPHLAGDIVRGPDGNMWFTSVLGIDGDQYDSIGRITPSGTVTFFKIPTYDSAPSGIAVGPDHNLWFAEGHGAIGRITTSGRIREFSTGLAGSEIAAIVAGPRRSMWFTDRGRHAVGSITMSGRVTEFPVPSPPADSELLSLARGAGNSLWLTVLSALKVDRLTVR